MSGTVQRNVRPVTISSGVSHMVATQENTVAVNTPDGNVSVTNADKAKAKAETKPSVTINFNVKANYDKLVSMAASMTDDDGVTYTIGRLAKEKLFTALGLDLTGEVLRVAKPAEPLNPMHVWLLGEDRTTKLTKADTAKLDKRIMLAMSLVQLKVNPNALEELKADLATNPIQ